MSSESSVHPFGGITAKSRGLDECFALSEGGNCEHNSATEVLSFIMSVLSVYEDSSFHRVQCVPS